MAIGCTNNSITSRRRFLTVSAAASVASVGALAAAAMPAQQAIGDDSALLALEEKFFEQKELADSYDAEINRLGKIWTTESDRMYKEALVREVQEGIYRTPQERWALVAETPACVEHNRLCDLQSVHLSKIDELVKEMWATPALT